jgi:hypothetical protein
MRTMPVSHLVLAVLILVGGLACGDEKGGGTVTGTGGSPGTGGRPRGSGGSGGQTPGTGGISASGGSGGATASGGTTGSGGSPEVDATGGGDTIPGDDGGGITETGEEVPAAPLCSSTTGGIGDDGLIDNFEDTNADILARDGRMGSWWMSINASTMVTGMPVGGPILSVAGGRTGKALHIVGKETEAMGWGVSVTATVVADGMTGCYDVNQYKSLKVALKGKVGTKVYVSLLTAPVRAVKETAGHYRREVTLTAAFVEHTIRFTPDFMQGWGAPPPLDLTKVYGVDVSPVITATALDFDFWVDDLAFAK